MAHTKRNEAQKRTAPKLERDLHEGPQIPKPEEVPADHSRASLETLSIGHACLRRECWPGAADRLSDYPGGASATALSAIRHRRPTPGRSGSHPSRPSERAETRFVLNDYEIVSD
jgi:hypothetical protein